MNKKIIAVTLIGVLSLGLTACNSKDTKSTTATEQPTKTTEILETSAVNLDFTKVDKDLKELMGKGEFSSVVNYEMVQKDEANITVKLVVAKGTTKEEADDTSSKLYTSFNESLKKHNPMVQDYFGIEVVVTEDQTGAELSQAMFD